MNTKFGVCFVLFCKIMDRSYILVIKPGTHNAILVIHFKSVYLQVCIYAAHIHQMHDNDLSKVKITWNSAKITKLYVITAWNLFGWNTLQTKKIDERKSLKNDTTKDFIDFNWPIVCTLAWDCRIFPGSTHTRINAWMSRRQRSKPHSQMSS